MQQKIDFCGPLPTTKQITRKDCWFYMRQGQKLEHENTVAESTTLKGAASVDGDLLKAITSDDGFMRAGAMPTVQTASKAGCKTLLDAVSKAIYFSETY